MEPHAQLYMSPSGASRPAIYVTQWSLTPSYIYMSPSGALYPIVYAASTSIVVMPETLHPIEV